MFDYHLLFKTMLKKPISLALLCLQWTLSVSAVSIKKAGRVSATQRGTSGYDYDVMKDVVENTTKESSSGIGLFDEYDSEDEAAKRRNRERNDEVRRNRESKEREEAHKKELEATRQQLAAAKAKLKKKEKEPTATRKEVNGLSISRSVLEPTQASLARQKANAAKRAEEAAEKAAKEKAKKEAEEKEAKRKAAVEANKKAAKERAGKTDLWKLKDERKTLEQRSKRGELDAESKYWKDAIEDELNNNDERWIKEQAPVDGRRYQMFAVSADNGYRYRYQNFAPHSGFTLQAKLGEHDHDTFTFLKRRDGTWCIKSDSTHGEATYSVYVSGEHHHYWYVKQARVYGETTPSNYGVGVDDWTLEADDVIDGEVHWKIKAGDYVMYASKDIHYTKAAHNDYDTKSYMRWILEKQ